MDRKQTLILIFVVILFGSQIAGMSWNILQGLLGIVVSLVILNSISPETYQTIIKYIPLLETLSWNNIMEFLKNVWNSTSLFIIGDSDEYCKTHCNCNSAKKEIKNKKEINNKK
jgi:hypothetical protein